MRAARTLSLRNTLVAGFLLVLAATLLIALLLVLYWRLPEIQRGVEHDQQRLAALVFAEFESSLDQTEGAAAALGRMLDAAPGSVDPALRHLVQGGELFAGAYLLDGQSRIEQMAATALDTAAHDDWLGNDLSSVEVVQRARQSGLVAWSDQFVSPIHGRPVIALALPLGGGAGRLLLFELASSRLAALARRAQAIDGLLVLILDRKGELVAGPEGGLESQRLNLANLPVVTDAGRGKLGGFPWRNRAYLGTAHRSERLGWTLLVGIPREVLDRQRDAAWTVSAAILLICALAGVLLFAAIARSLSRRIGSSVAYAQDIAEGRYPSPPKAGRIHELRSLDSSLARMAQRIQRRELELRGIVDDTPMVAIQRYDRQGRVLAWNDASTALYGWTREEALGRPLSDLFYSADQQREFVALIARIAEDGAAAGPYEAQLRHRDGHQLTVLSTTFAVPGEADDLVFVCMDIDVSERERAEADLRSLNQALEQRVLQRTASLSEANAELQAALQSLRDTQDRLVQSEKLAALGELVAGVAHELNTPIGNGLMAASTLPVTVDEFRREALPRLTRSQLEKLLHDVSHASDITVRNLQRAAELIASFKQVAVDRTSSQRRRFALLALVEEILLTLQPVLGRTPFRVEVEVASGLQLDSYPGPLGQTLTNLIQNALLHGLQGRSAGTIRIEACAAENEQVLLRVCDDGAGIAEGDRSRVFDPFFTTRMGQGGSGLGLHIVHSLVTAVLGGSIRLLPGDPEGTVAELRLPCSAPAQ